MPRSRKPYPPEFRQQLVEVEDSCDLPGNFSGNLQVTGSRRDAGFQQTQVVPHLLNHRFKIAKQIWRC